MHILLLGSTGFIGSNIFEKLLLKEARFDTIDRKMWDMNDPSAEVPIIEGITHIINAAGCTDFFSKQNINTNYLSPLKLFDAYPNTKIVHFGTAWTKYVNECPTPYLKAKQNLELELIKYPNVTILKPSIVVGHTEYGYHPLDQFFGFAQYCSYSHCYDDIRDKKVDLVPVDWCADLAIEMLSKPNKFKEYTLSAGLEACTLGKVFDCYNGVEFVGDLNEEEIKKVNKGVKTYRQFLELEATFDNNNLWWDEFDMPTPVVEIMEDWVDRLSPKTIMWRTQ